MQLLSLSARFTCEVVFVRSGCCAVLRTVGKEVLRIDHLMPNEHYGERFEQIAHLAQTDSEAFFREVGKLAGEAAVGVAVGVGGTSSSLTLLAKAWSCAA